MQITYLSVDNLTPYENNAKEHPQEQIEQIKRSIEEFGMIDPIGVWGDDNTIVEGHGRLIACKELGIAEVPVIRLDMLTDDQRKAYALAHNKLTMNSGFDAGILEDELFEIEFDMSQFGFDVLLDPEPATLDEAEIPDEVPVEPSARKGDRYKLGRHVLMCGDATTDDVQTLINGQHIDLMLTDPPYGIKADKGVGGFGTSPQTAKKYDDEWDDEAPSAEAFDALLNSADASIIFGGKYFTDRLPLGRRWIVWDKVGDIDFHNPYSDCELAWTNIDGNTVTKYTCIQQGFVSDENEKRVHPTQKPVKMLAEIIQDFSNAGDNVLDVFGGSGSVLMACEQTDRTCYMMEYEESYCDIIIKRWEQLTGGKAELIDR